jgi:ABC-type thiamine transport system ATPase subunit
MQPKQMAVPANPTTSANSSRPIKMIGQQNNNSAHRKAEGNIEDIKSNKRRMKTQIGTTAPLKLIFV